MKKIALCLSVSLVTLAMAVVACSDGGGTPQPIVTDAGTSADVAMPTVDATIPDTATPVPDATVDAAPPVKPTGVLDVKAAGSTSITLGTFTPTSGHAQYRPKPNGGGTLTAVLGEGTAPTAGRYFEITLYDDMGALDPMEKFAAAAPNGFALHKAQVETYEGPSKMWETQGDGEVVVDAATSTSVTLTFKNLGQFAPGGGDACVVSGTVTLPLVRAPESKVGTAALTFSNAQPEPITGEALNAIAPASALSPSAIALEDALYPFVGAWRTIHGDDTSGGVMRHFRIVFPSGHLPHEGQILPLNKFNRVHVVYFEGAALTDAQTEKVWEADNGYMLVQTKTDTSMSLVLQGAHMQSESPSAKGQFDWNGSIQITLP